MVTAPAPESPERTPAVRLAGATRTFSFLGDLAAYAGGVIALAVLYYAVGRLGARIHVGEAQPRVILPQSGIALAILVLFGLRFWPGVTLGSLGILLSASLTGGFEAWIGSGRSWVDPLLIAASRQWDIYVIFALANTLAAVTAAFGLQPSRGFSTAFGRISDVYRFLYFGFLLGPMISAAVVIWGLRLAGQPLADPSYHEFLRRWVGMGVSNLVIAPVFLTWRRMPTSSWPSFRFVELLMLLALSVILSITVFVGPSAITDLNYPVSFVPFPLIIWAALRFGARGAATLTFLVGAAAVAGMSRGVGPFVRMERFDFGVSTDLDRVFLLQIYLMTLTLSGLFLAAAVAERRHAQERLAMSREELRALSSQLLASREQERAAVAREIHDDLGQQLTALKMGLHSLTRQIERTGQDSGLPGRSRELLDISDSVLQSVRRLATELHPPILEHASLAEALEWLTDQCATMSGMDMRFHATEPARNIRMPSPQATAIFRVLQEALSNAARHSRATRVNVTLAVDPPTLQLDVEDDGIGLSVEEDATVAVRSSLGLIGMQERAKLLGGTCRLEGRASGGIAVRLRVPLDQTSQTLNPGAPTT